jgi:hypothetical protein
LHRRLQVLLNLTVSETFPKQLPFSMRSGRELGRLIESGSWESIFSGDIVAAALMLGASRVAAIFAVLAERKPVEEVAIHLSAVL